MIKYAFFGSSPFSVFALDELERAGLLPSVVVTTPDKPRGRQMAVTPTEVKACALARNIPVLDPAKLDKTFVEKLADFKCEVFIVVAYGKIIPKSVLDLPPHKTLNIHGSLLPKYRGASPMQTAILDDAKNTGVTIMRIDEEMDHGPIVVQEEIHVSEWPTLEAFGEDLVRRGGRLLAKILPDWIAGKISETQQDHSAATYTKKITKIDAELVFENGELRGDPYLNFRKIQAYHQWPQAYFFIEKASKNQAAKKMRVKITAASFKSGRLIIEKVVPEGRSEMTFESFASSYNS